MGAPLRPAAEPGPGQLSARLSANVQGTRNLLRAAEATTGIERFVLVSSVSVHGAVNPHTNPPRWTSQSPVKPQEAYAEQKAEAEISVREGRVPHCIVRLCAIYPVDNPPLNDLTLRFSFLLPYDRREHAIDVRDAALAIAHAADFPGVEGRTFDIGGADEWAGIGGELTNRLIKAAGMKPIPREAHRLPHPSVDDSWFAENWVDTSESQAALKYQRYSFAQYLSERRRRMGLLNLIIPLLAGVIFKKLIQASPYYGKPQVPDVRPFSVAMDDMLLHRQSND